MNQEEKEVGGHEATAYSDLEGIYREDGAKLPSALTSDTTRGNGHKLQLGWSHQEKCLLQKGGAAQ